MFVKIEAFKDQALKKGTYTINTAFIVSIDNRFIAMSNNELYCVDIYNRIKVEMALHKEGSLDLTGDQIHTCEVILRGVKED